MFSRQQPNFDSVGNSNHASRHDGREICETVQCLVIMRHGDKDRYHVPQGRSIQGALRIFGVYKYLWFGHVIARAYPFVHLEFSWLDVVVSWSAPV